MGLAWWRMAQTLTWPIQAGCPCPQELGIISPLQEAGLPSRRLGAFEKLSLPAGIGHPKHVWPPDYLWDKLEASLLQRIANEEDLRKMGFGQVRLGITVNWPGWSCSR